MSRQALPGNRTTQDAGTRRIYLRDGSWIDVALRCTNPDWKRQKQKPNYVCDFRDLADAAGQRLRCDWCGGEPGQEGMASGGLVRFYRITDQPKGIWDSAVAACPKCVFGGWRKDRQRLEWSDSIPGVPNLSDHQWTLLDVWHRAGDGYCEAATRLVSGAERDQLLEFLNAGGEG